jgi:hypothetical protein
MECIMNWKSLLTILGLDSKETLRAFLVDFNERAGGLDWEALNLEYEESIYVGDEEAGAGTWAYPDMQEEFYFYLDGKKVEGGEILVNLLNAFKLNVARTHFPANSHPGPWQLASAINGIMTLLGLPYKWAMNTPTSVLFSLVNDEDPIEIPVDRLIAFVRNILTRGDVQELSNPSRIYGLLKAHSIAR